MKISNHKLTEEFAKFEKTNKTSGNFKSGLPDTIVIHYTAGPSHQSAINTFKDSSVSASAHIVVDFDGSITQLIPFKKVGWHAGRSSWLDRSGLNHYSIGIEIVNAGLLEKGENDWRSWFGKSYSEDEVIQAVHRNQSEPTWWHRFTEEQITAVFDLCKELMNTYDIRYILGHEEISPGRKVDPGPAFPLDKIRERLLETDRRDDDHNETDKPISRGIVNTSALNIRSGPSAGTQTIASPLSRNTELQILDEQNGWYQAEVKVRGWVSKQFVDEIDEQQ